MEVLIMYKNLVLVDGEIMPAEEAAVSVHSIMLNLQVLLFGLNCH